jgi:hypothetical protein
VYTAINSLIFGAYALTAIVPSFQQPITSDAYLAGCEITHAWEDGSKLAYCPEDGATIAFDPDGQRYVNAAGAPLRAPGHWYLVEE